MAEKAEKKTTGSKLTSFLEKNRKGVLITFIVVVVLVAGFVCVELIKSSNAKKDLAAIEAYYYDLVEVPAETEDSEVNKLAADCIENLVSHRCIFFGGSAYCPHSNRVCCPLLCKLGMFRHQRRLSPSHGFIANIVKMTTVLLGGAELYDHTESLTDFGIVRSDCFRIYRIEFLNATINLGKLQYIQAHYIAWHL